MQPGDADVVPTEEEAIAMGPWWIQILAGVGAATIFTGITWAVTMVFLFLDERRKYYRDHTEAK